MPQPDEQGDSSESVNDSTTVYLSPEEKLRRKIEHAIDSKDDSLIINAWTSQCEQFASLQRYLPHIKEAKERDTAFHTFIDALQTNNDVAIVQSFNPILNGYARIKKQDWRRLSEAVEMYYSSCTFGQGGDDRRRQGTLLLRFAQAYWSNDDASIIAAYEAIQHAGYLVTFGFSSPESNRVERAKIKNAIYQQFQQALDDGHLKLLNDAYLIVRQNSLDLPSAQQDIGALAFRFTTLFIPYERGDDASITAENDMSLLEVYSDIEQSPFARSIHFTVDELKQIERAQRRQDDLKKIREAINIGRPLDIDYTYGVASALNENHLDPYELAILKNHLDPDELAILKLAVHWAKAYRLHGNSSSHPDVIAIMKEIATSDYRDRLHFPLGDIYATFGFVSDDEAEDPAQQNEQNLIAIVEGTPIHNKHYQHVYRVKQQYIELRDSQLQKMPRRRLNDFWGWITSQRNIIQEHYKLSETDQQRIAEQVLDDILDGFVTEKEINSLSPYDKDSVDGLLVKLYDEFTNRIGFQYPQFKQAHGLTDEDVREILRIYARREFLTDDLPKRHQNAIDAWLKSRRESMKVEIPGQAGEQSQPDEQRGRRGIRFRRLLKLVDWSGDYDDKDS